MYFLDILDDSLDVELGREGVLVGAYFGGWDLYREVRCWFYAVVVVIGYVCL